MCIACDSRKYDISICWKKLLPFILFERELFEFINSIGNAGSLNTLHPSFALMAIQQVCYPLFLFYFIWIPMGWNLFYICWCCLYICHVIDNWNELGSDWWVYCKHKIELELYLFINCDKSVISTKLKKLKKNKKTKL